MSGIRIELTKTPKPKNADTSLLGFGKTFTDHMFVMDYTTENGWHDARIVPYGNIELSPASMVLHYAQEIFEGMKAYRATDGRILLFRPEENFKRMNFSCDRMAIPQIDEGFVLSGLKELLNIDREWVPEGKGTSLYIRPFIFATQANLGVKVSETYTFMIIMSPVGFYFTSDLTPTKMKVETEYVRAVPGGTGAVKTGGNYAASLKSQEIANGEDYSQVLWLDGVERKYIEEVGAMNVFFVIGDEVITPVLNGSILGGITRKSVIDFLRSKGYTVSERKITIQKLYESCQNGTLKEAFGTGTAAVITSIGTLKWGDKVLTINDNKVGTVSRLCYDSLLGIQNGDISDEFGWIVEI